MHVAGLQVFEPPEGAGPEYVRDIYQRSGGAATTSAGPFGSTPPNSWAASPTSPGPSTAISTWSTTCDARRCRRPAGSANCLELTSRLHGTLLDRHRPLWESHLVEGLNDGRFAVYTKIHHALADGVSAMLAMRRALVRRPAEPRVAGHLGYQ